MAVAVSQSLLLIGGPRAMAVALGRVVVQSYWREFAVDGSEIGVGQRLAPELLPRDAFPLIGGPLLMIAGRCWKELLADCWPSVGKSWQIRGLPLLMIHGRCWEKLTDCWAADGQCIRD